MRHSHKASVSVRIPVYGDAQAPVCNRYRGRHRGHTVSPTFIRGISVMAFATLHFQSLTLAKACSMTVIVPECTVGTPPFPVCSLLHGLSDDHTSWARRTSIERHVAGLPLLVVMPDGGRGFYCRSYWIPGAYAPSIVR